MNRTVLCMAPHQLGAGGERGAISDAVWLILCHHTHACTRLTTDDHTRVKLSRQGSRGDYTNASFVVSVFEMGLCR